MKAVSRMWGGFLFAVERCFQPVLTYEYPVLSQKLT